MRTLLPVLVSGAMFAAAVAGFTGPAAQSVHGEDLNWREMGFVSPVKNQGSAGTCAAFAATAALETRYMLTRNDTSFCLDLSEQNLVWAGVVSNTDGGIPANAWSYFYFHGVVSESDLPYQATGSSPGPVIATSPNALVGKNLVVAIEPANTKPMQGVDNIKAALRNYGPLTLGIGADNEWYPGPGSYRDGHAVLVVGYHDDPTLTDAGGGYFIIKNSWGNNWGWNYGHTTGDGYAKIAYSTVTDYKNGLDIFTGGAYYTSGDGSTGYMQSSNWSGGTGTWSTSANRWSTGTWRNGEDQAVFSSPGGSVIVDPGVSAHGLIIQSTATGYNFTGGSLTVTAGGIDAQQSASFATPLTVGAPQTWTVASGKTLTVSSINLHISTLTIGGAGDTQVNGAITDVRTNPTFAGMMLAYSGSLIKSGTGTLTLAGDGSFVGTTRPVDGTIRMANPAALTYSALILQSGDTGVIDFDATTDLVIGGLSGDRNFQSASVSLARLRSLTIGNGNNVLDGVWIDPTLSYSGGIGGNLDLIKTGTYTQKLGGANTYSGSTRVAAGTLTLLEAGTLPYSTSMRVDAGATLDLNNIAQTVSSISGDGTLMLGTVAGLGPKGTGIGRLTVNTASDATFSGDITGIGALVKQGTGTLTLTGNNDFTEGLTIATGKMVFATTTAYALSGLPRFCPLTIQSGASAAVTAGQQAVLVRGSRNLKLGDYAFGNTASPINAQLDLADADAVLNFISTDDVRTLLQAGWNETADHWQGMGITSSTAAAVHGAALGYMSVDDWIAGHGNLLQTYDLSNNYGGDTLVLFTLFGDTNMDGTITATDLANLNAGYASGGHTWLTGDFNYDGLVNYKDFALMDWALSWQDSTVGAAAVAADLLRFGTDYSTYLSAFAMPVPEPTSLALLGLAALWLHRRRGGHR